MSIVQIIAAAFGFMIIALAVWQIAKRGIPEDNGKLPDDDPTYF